MSYRSLLFCPDEKTARTVTQVLTELEFAVEPCSEPFIAVKKLMGEHFDAIVVDCDNEQNATLLFKSARNSTSNQTSLAVAVVEGQAGVAKAFRIGANLVLTKPINVEQAKGTLRVARGLLRKGEPAKPITPVGTAPAATPPSMTTGSEMQAAPVPVKRAVPPPSAVASTPPPPSAPWQEVKPVHSSNSPIASSASAAHHATLDIDGEASNATSTLNAGPVAPKALKPAVENASAPSISKPVISPTAPSYSFVEAKAPQVKDVVKTSSLSTAASSMGKAAFGAASAPAPARSPADPVVVEPTASNAAGAAEAPFEKAADSGTNEPSVSMNAAAPSFSFGGVNAESPSGGSKKALLGVAAAVVVAAGLYIGWNQFHARATSASSHSGSTTPASDVATHVGAPQPAASSMAPTSTKTSTPNSQSTLPPKTTVKPAQPAAAADNTDTFDRDAEPVAKGSPKISGSLAAAKPAPAVSPAPEPIVIKKAGSSASPTKAVDTPAPSVMVATDAGGSLPNFIGDSAASAKPVLQTLNISQGVSRGLLIKKVQPNYPANGLRMHVEGAVQLLATIGKSGNITAVKTLSGEPILARAALDAVKQWKYKPYYLNGEPVEIQTQITVNFKLPH